MADVSSHSPRISWLISLIGLGLVVFAVVALSGPGRIDIIDGQTRFEVGRSIVEHGDSVLRDERIWWSSFPGNDGQLYSTYRFPQSLAAAAAILVADATGPECEGRRHFFFALCGAVCCGLLSIVYAIWFRQCGCRPFASMLWGAGGVFCTPTWFYGTSTFDEYLGTTVIVAALMTAFVGRRWLGGAVAAGLLLGLAYNCKQPLAAFSLLALALYDDPTAPRQQRISRAVIIVAGLCFGILAEQAYDRIKFPFDKETELAEYLAMYGPNYANNQLAAVAVLSVSLGAGIIWYFPPLLLCLRGLAAWWSFSKRIVLALIISTLPFLVFFSSLSFFKGDQCWGPRYLTPLIGILWLFAPAGAASMRRWVSALLLTLGIVVQLLALSVDQHRLYVQRDVSSGFGRVDPWLYFNPMLSHLVNRPREILEIAENTQRAEEFTPSPTPTFAFPLLDPPNPDMPVPEPLKLTPFRQRLWKRGPDVVREYRILNSFRPWWACMTYLPRDERPVDLGKSAALLLAIMSGGLFLLAVTATRIDGEMAAVTCIPLPQR